MRSVILLALLGSALAAPERQSRIVGGETISISRYPFLANMRFGFLGNWWYPACGGSLITPTAVLSAAHCYSGESPSTWRASLGSMRSEVAPEYEYEYDVSLFIIYPEYDTQTGENDVAIVKLARPAALSSLIQTARIAGSNYYLADGTVVYAAGWGALSPTGEPAYYLKHVAINIINQKTCASRYAHIRTITKDMLCAGILNIGGRGTCQGDYGGPLVHQGNVVVGIASWGNGCADAYYPGVNTRVSSYSNWIVNNARN